MSDDSSRSGDTPLLQRALALAERGLYTTTPNPRVGCVICKNGEVVGEGWHVAAGANHAEAAALAQAGSRAAGAEVYVSLEPCAHHGKTPPCSEALIRAGVARVVAAMPEPNPAAGGGFAALRAAGIATCFAEQNSALRRRAEQLNIGFISRLRRRRPWLRLKIAATLDGKTAVDSGLSRWISGEQARQDAHQLRACSCAVLTGIGTAQQDDPQLTVRHVQTTRQPLRLLVDSQLRADATMRLFADDNVLVASAQPPPPGFPAPTLVLATAAGKVDLPALMVALGERQLNEVLVEAGRQLNGALLADGLVDEIVLYLAGRVFGDTGKDMFKIPPLPSPAAAPAFRRQQLSGFDDGDIKVVYQKQQALDECLATAS